MTLASVFATIGLGLALLSSPRSVIAAPTVDPSEPAELDPPVADGPSSPFDGDDSGDLDSARQAFDVGLSAVESGQFEAAVTAFERAFRLHPHPVTLFNLALSLEKAERRAEAWELFGAALDIVESNTERQEIREHVDALASQIAILEIDADPRHRLCIDGLDMPEGEASNYRIALDPGGYAMLLDHHEFRVEIAAGERRLLLLEDGSGLEAPNQPSRLGPTMSGVAIGTSALAVGLGVSAALLRDPDLRVGLAAGAAASAGVAMTTSLIALLVQTRKVRPPSRRERAPKRRAWTKCPGSPALQDRLDLQLLPTINRPATFVRQLEAETFEGPVFAGGSPALAAGEQSVDSLRPRLLHAHRLRGEAQNLPPTTSP